MRCIHCHKIVHAPNGLWKTDQGRWSCDYSPDGYHHV